MEERNWKKFVNRNIAIGLLLGILNSMLFADIKVDKGVPQNTSVDKAQNGANIININTPNVRGISVNDFSEFRTKDPTVFNNFGAGVGRSYLAGMMAANPNLTKEQAARLILNRVGGSNRVEIENWLEVMSEKKTDIIFSSQNGFYLNNTGFINFDKAIFTTSRVDLDGNGDLLPFNIRGGQIDIGREGINAEGLQYLALLSKRMYIDGQIYAKDADVDLIAGDFDYNPNTRDNTKQGVNNNELLISSSAFGSIYGNQIKIVGINGNIGVAGDVISERVLKINADGTIVTNKTQSKEATEIKGKEYTQNTSTYTEGNLTIDADKVILKGNGTQAGNILITGDLENEVNIYSGTDINIGKGLVNKSGQIVAERNISVSGKTDNKDLLYAKNSITVGKELNNTGNIQSNGSIKTGGNVTNTGKILSEDELEINGKLTSSGTVYGKNKSDIKGELDNSGDIQSEGNITAGNAKNTGRIISDKNIEISGNLETEETVYAKESLNVKGNLVNKKDIQAEGNVTIGKDATNQGRLLSDKELKIKGNTNNSGTLYGKDRISLDKNLTNTGNIQTSGDLSAKDTINTGILVSEGNISLGTVDNSGEITANKKLTSATLENKAGAKISTGEEIHNNGTKNHGEINTNGNFVITGDLENYSVMNIGGLLTANNLLNTGNLKAVEKIYTSGVSFNNSGEILTTLLDINNTGILNTNKITVIDNARLNGSNVTNNGYISGTNIEIITAGLTNTGTLAADELIKANNTTINNTGYIGSNTKINLSGSNLTNSGTIESSDIELYNMSGYSNTNLIRGGNVSLTSTGNLTLTGTLHGENWLQVHGHDIWNNGATTGTGYIEIKGRDITNNTELASNTVVVEGTGNIINNYIITGENGRISGNNIVNNDLIAFSDQLGLIAAEKITNNAGKAIYGGNLLDAEFNTFENLRGELLSTGTINLRGDYLLNSVGTIQSSNDILLNIAKIDNIGEVTGLTDYEIYYKTWDGQIYTEAEFNNNWAFGKEENAGSNAGRVNHFNSILTLANAQGGFNSLLDYYYGAEIRSRFVTDGEFGVAVSDTLMYPGESIKGILKSNAQTTYANISAGNDIQITATELNNKDGKISAGNTAELTASTIRNETTLGAGIQLKDGYEEVEWHGINSTTRPVRYRRLTKNGDLSYVTGQASVIEARNLIINTGTLILTAELPTGSQIINGSTTSGGSVAGKTVNTGTSNGSGLINIVKNITPVTEIIISGILPIDPLGAVSSLFTMTKAPDGNNITQGDSISKYLLETRSKYINLGDFYGSDYYLSRIGYDENSDWNKARRLGDAYYEYLLVTRAISDKLGTRFINGLSDKELMKAMLDNSVELQKNLQLSVGVALTPDQVKALKSDIIWYEYEVVNGEKVLVPKVYLSQATLTTIDIDGRNKVGGLELTVINADELRNNGQVIGNGGVTYVNAGRVYNVTSTNELAEIKGNDVTIVATVGNIENIGGRIRGIESVVLSAENGDIINSSSIRTSLLDKGEFHRSETDHILSIGSIESDGTTYIEGKNYISEAGYVSGKTVVIDAKENILIGSATLSGEDKFGNDKDNYQYFKGTQKVGSEIVGTNNVILGAGNNIDIKGSTIGSDGTIQMTAKNVNIENEKETTYLEAKAKYGGTFENTESESRRSNEYAAASTLIGKNIIIDAENDINVRASNLIAVKDSLENTGGNISLAAGNDVNILVDTLENSSYSKIKTSGFSTNFSSGGGGLTAGVSYNRSSLEQQGNGTTVAVSTIISEGNTVIDAGNRVRTEAMQANIGENLVIRGTNGVELLDAQEVYEEKVKQSSSSIGLSVSVGSTVSSFIDQANGMYDNKDKYGTGNTSQLLNSAGDGFTLFRSGVSAFNDAQSIYDSVVSGIHPANGLAGITANVSLSYSQSSYESNTKSSASVGGNINVGKNFILQSDGDVLLVNQKVNVGENFVVDAKNFEARAGENTYSNNTKSSSSGGSIGYDVAQKTVTGGINVSGGKSNTDSKYYDNTIINVGGTFQLTTKEDALFAGANVTADKINFDIGRDLSIISLQDESKSGGKNYGAGLGYSEKDPTTNKTQIGSITGNVSYGQNNSESKWVNNQTSIIANNGGNISVGETLTNAGSIIGSLNTDSKLSIDANKVVVSNLEDYNRGENAGVNVGGIGLNNNAPIGQTGVQYGSHDKEQNTKATFVNTEVTEAGKKLNLEEIGINTDISKAQVVTKDEVVEQIDTNLHTDLLNDTTRKQFVEDTRKAGHGILDIIDSASNSKLGYEEARTDRYAQYYIEKNPQMMEFIKDPDSKNAKEIEQMTKEYIKYMTGKDVEVVIVATGDGSGYIRGDQLGEGKKDVLLLDVMDLASGINVSDLYGHEPNHVDDHRRGREAGDEVTSGVAGDRLTEILGEDGQSNKFNLSKWLNDDGNLQALSSGRDHLASEYDGYEIEGYPKVDNTKCVQVANPSCYKQYIPESQYNEIMKNAGNTFAPLKGVGDSLNNVIIVKEEKNSGKNDTKPKPPTTLKPSTTGNNTTIKLPTKPRDLETIHLIILQAAIDEGKVPEMFSYEVAENWGKYIEGNSGEYLDTKSLIGTKITQAEYDAYKVQSNVVRYTEEIGNALTPAIVAGMTLKINSGKAANENSKKNELLEELNKNSKEILYENRGKLQEPYSGPRQEPTLIDGKYKDAKTGYTIKGKYTYVIDAEGNLQMAKDSKLGMGGGHTSLSNGKPVKYAGTMEFSNGKLINWDNGSGHYKPIASQAPEISEIFKSLGIYDATMDNFTPDPINNSAPIMPKR
ncbi:hemagglutinin repeat-containing protein [Sebaldella sp. S0638]|uniref:hemagglutinin repeat-containing protein n=1 Tax=Sebaldella sp. S0638 TaxID=2957809 RepID=UPI00209D335B|nr:hemagglutinin repeat-containing protein [Sebaldella sp. S0638]MCP1226240.1 hemagglutinin repeat-containing protein [Sebaldella sp. S0638]